MGSGVVWDLSVGVVEAGGRNAGGDESGGGPGGGDHAAEVRDRELADEAGAGAGVEAAPGAHPEHETLRRHQTQLRPSRPLPRARQTPTCPLSH